MVESTPIDGSPIYRVASKTTKEINSDGKESNP